MRILEHLSLITSFLFYMLLLASILFLPFYCFLLSIKTHISKFMKIANISCDLLLATTRTFKGLKSSFSNFMLGVSTKISLPQHYVITSNW